MPVLAIFSAIASHTNLFSDFPCAAITACICKSDPVLTLNDPLQGVFGVLSNFLQVNK